ncbi:MAG: acetyl-CoA acetyltransferase [Ilumatobacteraceae bacterium]
MPAAPALDPRTPVLVGAGQYSQKVDELGAALDPVSMMAEAARLAAGDAGLAGLPTPDSVRVVSLLSWRYGDPAAVLADMLGVAPRQTAVTTMGGNSPQSLVNATAADIAAGRLDIALLAGGEASRTRQRARKAGVEPDWPRAPESRQPDVIGHELEMSHPVEQRHGIYMPVQVYPMFETAIRAASGATPAQHLDRISRLWSRFSQVAESNPHAWSRTPRTAAEIATPTASNRMIGLPYTKYMNSNNDVDMAAALVMCSAGTAEALGVPRDRWVFPHSGTDCHEHDAISERWSFAETPAIALGGRRALDLAGLGVDDIDLVDLYSCFPAAVQLGAQSLGLSVESQLTRTGGLPFAGGPWNNYVMHAIATVMHELRDGAGTAALVWANGGFATKHAFGVYRTTPPTSGFRHESPQAQIDALPRRPFTDDHDGAAVIEAYTVMHDRDGRPVTSLAACLTDEGHRVWATSTQPDTAEAMCTGEWVGHRVRRAADGTLHL